MAFEEGGCFGLPIATPPFPSSCTSLNEPPALEPTPDLTDPLDPTLRAPTPIPLRASCSFWTRSARSTQPSKPTPSAVSSSLIARALIPSPPSAARGTSPGVSSATPAGSTVRGSEPREAAEE
eukprot:1738040-Rhodomonas_salina.1